MMKPVSRLASFTTGVLGCLVLVGCKTVGPDFDSVDPADAPRAFQSAEASPASALPIAVGWAAFEDPVLLRLIDQALAFSPRLEEAEARLAEARALLGLTLAATQPSLQLESAVQLAGESAESPALPARRERGDRYQVALAASFEPDLWGRLRRAREAGEARLVAARADLEGARRLLAAEVARAWFSHRGLRAEASILAETLLARRDAVALREADFEAGLRPANDLHRARLELATVEIDLAVLRPRLDQARLALQRLCGPLAEDALESAPGFTTAPPAFLLGLPAAVLSQRPDIAAAEAILHARTAEIGVAEAERYPDLRLGASLGLENTDLGDLLERPSQFWQIGPSLHLPVFDGGRGDRGVDAARARAAAAAAAYRGTVLDALREIENDLAVLRRLAGREAAILSALEAAEALVGLSRSRYESGLSSFLEVVDAEQAQLELRRSRQIVETEKMLTTASLLRNLGG